MSFGLKPCPFCGGEANEHIDELDNLRDISCADCSVQMYGLWSTDVCVTWNTRITFDWFAPLVMCQMWKNDRDRAASIAAELDFCRIERDKAQRLLLKATQCLSALCDGNALTDDTRRLRIELEQWVSEAMPF